MLCALCHEWQDMQRMAPVERLGATTLHVCKQRKRCMIVTLEHMYSLADIMALHSAMLSMVPKDA